MRESRPAALGKPYANRGELRGVWGGDGVVVETSGCVLAPAPREVERPRTGNRDAEERFLAGGTGTPRGLWAASAHRSWTGSRIVFPRRSCVRDGSNSVVGREFAAGRPCWHRRPGLAFLYASAALDRGRSWHSRGAHHADREFAAFIGRAIASRHPARS